VPAAVTDIGRRSFGGVDQPAMAEAQIGTGYLLTVIAGLAATPEDERSYEREAAGPRSCFLLVALTPFTNMTCQIASYPGLPPLRANAKTALGALAP